MVLRTCVRSLQCCGVCLQRGAFTENGAVRLPPGGVAWNPSPTAVCVLKRSIMEATRDRLTAIVTFWTQKTQGTFGTVSRTRVSVHVPRWF